MVNSSFFIISLMPQQTGSKLKWSKDEYQQIYNAYKLQNKKPSEITRELFPTVDPNKVVQAVHRCESKVAPPSGSGGKKLLANNHNLNI